MSYRYRIKELIQEKHRRGGDRITIGGLARELGMSTTTLSRMANQRNFSTRTEYLYRIMAFFNVGAGSVFEYIRDGDDPLFSLMEGRIRGGGDGGEEVAKEENP